MSIMIPAVILGGAAALWLRDVLRERKARRRLRDRLRQRESLSAENVHAWVDYLRESGVDVVEEIPEMRI